MSDFDDLTANEDAAKHYQLPWIDGIAYLTDDINGMRGDRIYNQVVGYARVNRLKPDINVTSSILVYTIDSRRVSRKEFYDICLTIVGNINIRIDTIQHNLSSYIPVIDVENIIMDYIATPTYVNLKNSLIKSEKIFSTPESNETLESEVPMIRSILKRWPKGW